MRHYNFEEQLERKLKDREIKPSADAWERVTYNRQQQNKRKRNLLRYFIPAAAVLCIGAFLVFNNSGTEPVNNETIVIKEQKKDEGTKIQQQGIIDTPTETAVAVNSETKAQQTPPVIINSTKPESEKETASNTLHKDTPEIQDHLEIKKANEVAIAISEIIKKDGPVTDNEIDSLLLKAQREIVMERIKANGNNTGTDEAALLKEAETQVEKSFRDKVYDVFNHKFRTIKIAIKQ